jgi:hypothetical protein
MMHSIEPYVAISKVHLFGQEKPVVLEEILSMELSLCLQEQLRLPSTERFWIDSDRIQSKVSWSISSKPVPQPVPLTYEQSSEGDQVSRGCLLGTEAG